MKMQDDDLLRALQDKEEASAKYVWGELATTREQSRREYYKLPYGNEQEDWSQIVASDVSDTVEWVLPSLLKIFTSTDKAVSFEPSRANDVKGAEQATDACNYVFYKQNNGFLILYTAFKDALIAGNAAVMWRKEAKESVISIPFQGATDEMLALMLQEDGAEIQEVRTEQVVDQMTGQVMNIHTGRLKRIEKRNLVKVEAFDPNDLLVDAEWTSPLLQDCPYVCRVMEVTLSDLKLMGFDVDEEDLEASDRNLMQREVEETAYDAMTEDLDTSQADGYLRIEFVLMDRDGDGIAERLCVYRLQDKILKIEEVSHVPIATASPILNTHQWAGMSMAEAVSDLQKLHTELLRQTLNNLYLTNNPRTKVLTDSNWSPLANIDDLLDSRPGGIIRARDPNAIQSDVIPFAAGASLPMLEYVQGMRENRTGVSRTSMGLNPDSLNNTATGRQIDQSAAQQRIELVARIFAEILVKPIFQGILKTLTDGGIEKLAFRLRDEFVEYDPNEWRDQYDMTIHVGLGTGDKMAQAAALMQIMTLQEKGMALGMVQPKHLYHSFSKLIENAGFKDVQSFAVDPTTLPPQPQQPPLPIQIEQMKLQADQQKFQAQMQADQQKRQIELQAKLEETRATLELQAANDQRDAEREAMKAQYDAQLEQQRLEFEKWKAEFDAQTKIYIEEMKVRGVPPSDVIQQKDDMLQVLSGLQAVIQQMNTPKVIVRDASGRAIGVQPYQPTPQE
jgi:hypothetical protein